jgi:hypothetical protein
VSRRIPNGCTGTTSLMTTFCGPATPLSAGAGKLVTVGTIVEPPAAPPPMPMLIAPFVTSANREHQPP